ncbi:hypothetical protein AYO38_11195 [bacterium SCGC AG-212-C10]|nr:hypothetical protein AYO38_11195 [bacterium SCGC AG-212-C10]
MIATCQRIEVYGNAKCSCSAPVKDVGVEALFRLGELAAGLHSAVLGEAQVLGQVRSGLSDASPAVQRLFACAIGAARRLRAEAEFAGHTGHLLDAALANEGGAAGGSIAILGAGVVGRLVVARAVELGFEDITVFARKHPETLADLPGLRCLPFASLEDVGDIDVLVSCVGASAGELSVKTLPRVNRFALDLGTPRTIPPGGVPRIVTIAHLMANESVPERRAELRTRLRELIAERMHAERADRNSHIGRMRFEVEVIRRQEVGRIQRLHPEIPATTVEAITSALVNQILHRPSERLRSLDDPVLGERFASLFAAESDLTMEAQR